MGLFDGYNDSPGHIKTEGETISVSYQPGVPASGQATIEWSIPNAAQGCGAAEDGRGAYCGIVVTLSDSPQQPNQAPVDGVFYTNDPTADPDKFAGDSINGARVVGAFYEGERRARGESLTTSLVVQDHASLTNYYFAVYAVDCQGRYHTSGVRAFSSELGQVDEPNSPSTQIIELNNGEGVQLTDGTNLIPGQEYAFDVEVNSNFPNAAAPEDIINVSFDGIDAPTYADLIDEVNKQLSLADNPPQSPVPPFSGSFYVDSVTARLSQYDGTSYDPISALFELTDPTDILPGAYWFNPTTQTLFERNTLGTDWDPVDLINYHDDPTNPQGDDYWFDGTIGRKFNGSVWCEVDTITSTTDPAAAPGGSTGLFWYDTSIEMLMEWNEVTSNFDPAVAITYFEDPRNLTVGTYWFNDATNELHSWNGSTFVQETNFVITSQTPINPTNNLLWYDPEHETLRIATENPGPGGVFVDVPFLIWDEDPSTTESCDLWWNTTTDELNTWDTILASWVPVVTFVQQDIDPTLAVIPEVGTLWFNPTNDIVSTWDGSAWSVLPTIAYPSDPRSLPAGIAWLNSNTGELSIRDVPVSGWNVIDPIDLDSDPSTIEPGTYWFDLTSNTLFERIGSAWVPIPHTSAPITRPVGELWFDTENDVLNEWNGSMYVPSTPILTIGLTSDGNLALQTSQTGSCAAVMLLVPGTSVNNTGFIGTGFADFHSYGHYYSYTQEPFNAPPLQNTDVPEAGFLFNNIPGRIFPQEYGEDGLAGTPMYDIVGVGTDGTPDERRELSDSIRAQLGHPVVEVELTPYMIDTAIQGAVESLRKRSDIAYERGFFFLDVDRGNQVYQLTNIKAGYDRIVGVMAANRMTSAFLNGAGLYGQVMLQHLYNMGSYDLTSFHLVAQYVEQMEHLFATRITFNWQETSRTISLHQSFHRPERILLDCYVERTEQALLKDRWCKTWIEKYALAESRIMLAEIRGKYASLPGAGGGVSLNASDLAARGDADKQDLYQQLDDYVASHVENFGMGTQFVIG